MLSVFQNPRFEDPRSNFRSTKRPVAQPNVRAVNPRLEHDSPSDPVTGLGRRKIPASTQKPSKATNVCIVYPRLLYRNFINSARNTIHEGDVVFVSKHSTLFGTAQSRLSRICSWREVDAFLKSDQCKLDPSSDVSKNLILQSRRMMRDARIARLKDTLSLKIAMERANQPVSFAVDSDISVLKAAVKRSKKCVKAVKTAISSKKAVSILPGEDWAFVRAFVDWKMDGVLHSKEIADINVSDLYATSEEEECLMNVCVHGPCMVRNHGHSKERQFFDDAVSPGEVLFMCVVSVFEPDGSVSFRLKPASGRQLSHLMSGEKAGCAPGGTTADFGIEDLLSTVAAWRLARVIDDRKVVLPARGVEASVAIDLLTIDDFWGMISQTYGTSAMEERIIMYDKRIMKGMINDLNTRLEEKRRIEAYTKMMTMLAKEEAKRKRKLEKSAKLITEAGKKLVEKRQQRRQEAAQKLLPALRSTARRAVQRKREARIQELTILNNARVIQIQARKSLIRSLVRKNVERRRNVIRRNQAVRRLVFQKAAAERRLRVEEQLLSEARFLDAEREEEKARLAVEEARAEAERLRIAAEKAELEVEVALREQELAEEADRKSAEELRRMIAEDERIVSEVNAELDQIQNQQVEEITLLVNEDEGSIEKESETERLQRELEEAMEAAQQTDEESDSEEESDDEEEMIDLPIEEVTDDEDEPMDAEDGSFQDVVKAEESIQKNLLVAHKRWKLMLQMSKVGLPLAASMRLAQSELWETIIRQRAAQREQAYRDSAPADFDDTVAAADDPSALGIHPIVRTPMKNESELLTIYNAMKTAQRAGTLSPLPKTDWSLGWMKEPYSMEFGGGFTPNWNLANLTKGRMLTATSTGAYRRLMSRPAPHRTQYYVASNFLRDIGYAKAVDSQRAVGIELTDYATICAGFLQLEDGGLLHQLCVLLADAQKPNGDKAFPYVVQSGRIKFMPPREVNGMLTFPRGFDTESLLQKAKGNTLEQKMNSLSKSLNFVFCMSHTRKWQLDGSELKRYTDDKALWRHTENATDDIIEDMYDISSMNGVGLNFSQSILNSVVLGIASYATLGAGSMNKISGEMASVGAIASYSGGGPLLFPNSTQAPIQVDALMGGRTFSPGNDTVDSVRILPSGATLDKDPAPVTYEQQGNFSLGKFTLPPLGAGAPPSDPGREGLPDGVATPYKDVVEMDAAEFAVWVESVPTDLLRTIRDQYLKQTLGLKGDQFTRLSAIVNKVKKDREDNVTIQRSQPPIPPPDLEARAYSETLLEQATSATEPRYELPDEDEPECDSLDGCAPQRPTVGDVLYQYGSGAASLAGSGLLGAGKWFFKIDDALFDV